MTELTPQQRARLARLRNHATLYEVVLTHETTGERRLLCYTRRSDLGLRDYVARHAEAIVAFTGSENYQLAAGKGMQFGSWVATFSGRTQREAIMHGTLPWFKDADHATTPEA